jgi:mRNA interferase MazF
MVRPVKGDIVVLPFPFTNMQATKKRPAFVLAKLFGNDVILCQITSRDRGDGYSIFLSTADFISGRLNLNSYIRPNHLFTAESSTIEYVAGKVSANKVNEVVNKVIQIVQA